MARQRDPFGRMLRRLEAWLRKHPGAPWEQCVAHWDELIDELSPPARADYDKFVASLPPDWRADRKLVMAIMLDQLAAEGKLEPTLAVGELKLMNIPRVRGGKVVYE